MAEEGFLMCMIHILMTGMMTFVATANHVKVIATPDYWNLRNPVSRKMLKKIPEIPKLGVFFWSYLYDFQ